jgi:transposase
MDHEKTKIYKTEFREFSVKMAIYSDKPIAEIAKDLGISPNTLHTWISKYSLSKLGCSKAGTDDHLYEELKRLQKENALLTKERDLLRKAAACIEGVLSI